MKYLLIIFFITGLAYAQVPVITDSTFFYADSISQTITLGKNEFLGQVWFDADRSKTIYPQVYDDSKAKWSWLDDDGAKYTITTSDSTLDFVIPLKPIKFYVAKKIRFVITSDPTDTFSVRYDKRPY